MNVLEKGELEGTDLSALGKALGHVEAPEDYPDSDRYRKPESHNFDYLAFNYNPYRQDDDFFNNVKNRLVVEGFDKKKIAKNKVQYTIPGFLWKGLDSNAKQRFARELLAADYNFTGVRGDKFHERTLGRNFGSLMAATFAPNEELHLNPAPEGTPVTYGLDHNGSQVTGSYEFTELGIEWTEHSRTYARY